MSGIVGDKGTRSGDKSGIVGRDQSVIHSIMDSSMIQSGHRSSGSSTPTDTGIAGNFVTKYGSDVSFFVIHWHCSMFHLNNSSANAQIKICIRSGGSNTTYDADDDLNANNYGWYHFANVTGSHFPLDYYGLYKTGSSTVVNMTSYTAGTTVDARVFVMTSAGTAYFPHQNGMYLFEATEYLRSR